MKKIIVSLMILSIAPSFSFAAGAAARDQAPLIGIAMPETHVERWIKDGKQLAAEAEERGYRAVVQWANADQAAQNQQIQSFLTQGARLLVVGNINDGVAPVIAEAARDGVQVIAYDRIIANSDQYNYFITFNNFKVGVLQGEGIVAGLDLRNATAAAPKTITLFAGSPTDGNAFFFFDGAMSVLNPFIERGVLRVVGPHPRTSKDTANFIRIATEGWQAPVAKTRMENLLANEARGVVLDAVLAPNDTLARAIIEALKVDAKYRTKLPVVTGQDAEIDSLVSIRRGEQFMTVFKDTNKLAEAAIILADAILKGQTPNIPGAVIASGDLREIGNTGRKHVITYLLDPISITRANTNIPVDAGFYTPAELAKLR